MRRSVVIILATSLAFGVTGCGSGQNDSADAVSLLKKGCKEFQQNLLKKTSDSAYVETFSRLAILNPAYLEISKAAGVYSTTNLLMETSQGSQFRQMFTEAVGTLYGLCQSVK
jgi:hypothetical protein